MRVVIAPDSFKGTVMAAAAAQAIAAGWRQGRLDDDLVLAPMADGGEGTLDAFETLPGAIRVPIAVVDALGGPREASWVRLPDGTGVVELAECCGLLTIEHLAPRQAHTVGFGLAIRAALEAGVERLLLGIGGSASTDGGAGLLSALGVELLDAGGALVERPGNVELPDVVALGGSPLRPPAGGVTILCDVTNPLLGTDGAAAVFGPQKGGASLVDELDANLAGWARLLGGDVDAPGSGAAGGVGYALQWWGAETASGARRVAEAIGLDRAIDGCDLVVTGEGSFDAQSGSGKAVSVVRDLAGDHRVAVIAGRIEADTSALAAARSLSELHGGRALEDTEAVLAVVARTLAEGWRD